MRSRFLWLPLLFLVGYLPPAAAHANPVDSLKALILNAEHDTLRAKYTNALGTAFFNSDLDSAMFYWQQALKMGEDLSESDDPAVQRAGKLQVMKSASNTAVIHQYRGLYPLAIKQYQRCLRLAEELHDRRGTMIALNNIGLIKMGQEKPAEALDYFQRSQAIAEERMDSLTMSTTLNNIGTALKRLNRHEEALAMFRKSLLWSEIVGNEVQMVDNLINIGSIHMLFQQPDSALATFTQSLEMANAIEYSLGKPQILLGISESYGGIGQLDKALAYAQAGLDSARALDLTEEIVGALERLAEVQHQLGQDDLAFNTISEYNYLKDSLFSTDKALEFGQLEQSFDYERKELESELQARAAEAELRQQNLQQYLISFGTVCVVALLLIVGIRLAKSRRLRYFVVFGALLVFFEFALVLLDSFIDGFTGGLPIPKLLANILLAALLAPLNVVLEKRLMTKKRDKGEAVG